MHSQITQEEVYKKWGRKEIQEIIDLCISLTCVLCKVMESLIRDVIVLHLSNHQLIRPSQHGFLAGRSTVTNLLEYMETLTKLLDDGQDMLTKNVTVVKTKIWNIYIIVKHLEKSQIYSMKKSTMGVFKNKLVFSKFLQKK